MPPNPTSDEQAPPARGTLAQWLAATNLLFALPLMFLVVTLVIWRWSTENEAERVSQLTAEEAGLIADALVDRLRGHVDVSTRSGNRWQLRGPEDRGAWDYDLFSRRWLHPELETVEWLDSEGRARWWPSDRARLVPSLVAAEDLALAVEEHRVVLAGPYFLPRGKPVSVTIVPLDADDGPEWVVSVYDLERVARGTRQGANNSFAALLSAGAHRIFASHADDFPSAEVGPMTVPVTYDRLGLDLQVWPRQVGLERFHTELPRMVLIGGLLATIVLTLGIRLAQISSQRAIESRLTASLQAEVRARTLAEKSLERKLQELSRSNREFERFAYVISHDLRDPLNAIQLNVQSVLTDDRNGLPPDARHRLQQGATAVSRLDGMIGSLLEYARAGSGADGLELVDSREALADALANVQGLIDGNRAAVRSGPLPKVIAHRSALVRLFQNLVANAVKYRSERAPEVHIEAVKADDEWIFSVADNARGMDSDDIEHAFDLFWRHQEGSGVGGEGIGLAVCKRIVERHGGRMWLESRKGEGTTVFFSWPADPEVAAAQRRRAAAD